MVVDDTHTDVHRPVQSLWKSPATGQQDVL